MISRKIKDFKNNPFLKNVALLFSGTVFSQALLFLFSPILSRIFSTEDFGNFSNYNAWVMVLAIISNLRYEHAVIIAKNRTDSYRVLNLTLALSFISFLIFSILLFLIPFFAEIKYLKQIEEVLPFLTIGTFILCVNSVFIQLNIKYAKFKTYTVVSLMQVLITLGVQLTFGFFKIPNGLIVGTIAGHFLSAIVLIILFFKINSLRYLLREFNYPVLKSTALEFITLPKFSMPTDIVNGIIQQFLPVLILAYFDPIIAGLYFFSTRVIKTPVIVFSSSFGTVLRQKAAEIFLKGGTLNSLFIRTFKNLVLIAFVPFLLLYIFGEEIFILVFGEQWKDAGKIISILTPGIFVEFIAMPLSVLFLVTNNQKYNFIIQSIGFVMLALAIIIGKQYFDNFIYTCYFISGITIIINIISLIFSYKIAVHPKIKV